jgi:hypothetical protein
MEHNTQSKLKSGAPLEKAKPFTSELYSERVHQTPLVVF